MPLHRVGEGPDPRNALDVRPFRILELDPGGTTGWASATYDGVTPLKRPEDIFWDGDQIGPHEHHIELWTLLHMEMRMAFVEQIDFEIGMESFDFRQNIDPKKQRNKVELISREYIGIVRLFCAINNVPLTQRNASSAKTFIPDKGPMKDVRIKLLGLDRPRPQWEHYMDAMRHLLRHIVVEKKIRQPFVDRWLNEDEHSVS